MPGIALPEAYAALFGLSYHVRSAKEIHWSLQRNILFMHDSLHTDPDPITEAGHTFAADVRQGTHPDEAHSYDWTLHSL